MDSSRNQKTILENAYQNLKKRCYYKKDKRYADYGGRGITVCSRWMGSEGFRNFCVDMGARPSKIYSLDRIDNEGNYEPSNCRWATKKSQSSNRRNNINVSFRGDTITLREYCRRRNMKYKTVWMRYKGYGWTLERAMGL